MTASTYQLPTVLTSKVLTRSGYEMTSGRWFYLFNGNSVNVHVTRKLRASNASLIYLDSYTFEKASTDKIATGLFITKK